MGVLLLFLISCVSSQLDLPPIQNDRSNQERYNQDRYNADGYNQDRYNQDRYNQDNRFNQERFGPDRGQFSTRETDFRNILAKLDFTGTERCSANVGAQWNYETNVNEYTQIQAVS